MALNDKNPAVKEKESVSSDLSRRFKQNPALFIGTVVVLVLVIVSFVLVPAIVPEGARAGGDLTFGYYDKAPISWVPGNMFAQYQEQAVRSLQAQGREVSDYRTAAEVWRWAFEGAVVHTAILQIMKRSNYSVPERTVDREVARLPQFQEGNPPRFSPTLYKQTSDSSRLVLWRQVNEELTKMPFIDDYFDLLIPSTEVKFIADMSSVMRNFEMVYFKVDDYPESEYLAYALEHSELFDSIYLSRITISSSEREAKKILASINDGTVTFEDAARAQSQDSYADRGGDMGRRYGYQLESDIPNEDTRRIILGLGRGELSDLVRIGDNWAIFRVEEELKKADFEDETIMESVRPYVRNFERGRMEDWAIDRANEFIADAKESSFDNAARWRNMERLKFGPFPVNYGGVNLFPSLESFSISGFNEQDIQNMSRNENFWNIAFSTNLQTPSEPLVQGSNVLVLFPLEQIVSDEDAVERVASMYYSYVDDIARQSIQYYFLTRDKMEDNFWEVYFRVFMPY